MNLETYQPLARRTMKELGGQAHIDHMAIGMAGEIGELCDAVKKAFVYGKIDASGQRVFGMEALDRVNLEEEGGDDWWYIVGAAPELGVPLDKLAEAFDEGRRDIHDCSAVQLILTVNARVAGAAFTLVGPATTEFQRALALTIAARALGSFYAFFGLDLANSLDRNIAKLAKRYGDKYSDLSASVRDLAAEREVLEGGVKTKAETAKK